MRVEIYCDGSSEGNSTGKGGYGYVIVVDGVKHSEGSGHMPVATNNTAEITAAIEGLKYVSGNSALCGASEIIIVSDSQLVLKYATGEYRCKKPHLIPFYIELRKYYGQLKATTRWVKGHNGDKYNETCDRLAKAAKSATVQAPSHSAK
jgi:ribonuclease HI